MKILAFAASNSRHSINKQLAIHASNVAVEQLGENTKSEILDINDYTMPIYGIDHEEEHGVPEKAQAFLDKIDSADALIISFAEHNGSYTAAYKSLFDWASRIRPKVYLDKVMLVLSTSPGKGGAASVNSLATGSAPHFGASVCASLSIPTFNQVFDTDAGKLNDKELITKLQNAVEALQQALVKKQ